MSAQSAPAQTVAAPAAGAPPVNGGSLASSGSGSGASYAKAAGRGAHAQNGRKDMRKAGGRGTTQALVAQCAALSDKAAGDSIAARDAIKEAKDLQKQLSETEEKLKKSDLQLATVSSAAAGMDRMWQGVHKIEMSGRYVRTNPICLILCVLPLVLVHLWLVFDSPWPRFYLHVGWYFDMFSWVGRRFVLYGAIFLPTYFLCVLIGLTVDAFLYLRGYTRGGCLAGWTSWVYHYRRDFIHDHEDRRSDSTSLQALKHGAKYREYTLEKRLGSNLPFFRGLLQFYRRVFALPPTLTVVSIELFQQIATAKNLDPYLSASDARSSLQRSAANNSSVNIDRSLLLADKMITLETVSLAFALYCQYKEAIADRDFLPVLPPQN